jgi:hypothetical protein
MSSAKLKSKKTVFFDFFSNTMLEFSQFKSHKLDDFLTERGKKIIESKKVHEKCKEIVVNRSFFILCVRMLKFFFILSQLSLSFHISNTPVF